MKFNDKNFDLTDKELEFAKAQPEVFSKYLDYCRDKLKIQEKLIDREIKNLEVEKDKQKTIQLKDAQMHEEQMAFWSSIASLGVGLTFESFSKKTIINKESIFILSLLSYFSVFSSFLLSFSVFLLPIFFLAKSINFPLTRLTDFITFEQIPENKLFN